MRRRSKLATARDLLGAAILLGCANVSFADNDKGLYLGAGVGIFNLKTEDLSDLDALEAAFDSDDTSFKVFGGWRFNKYIAAELDYIDFGSPDDDVQDVRLAAEIDGFAPYLIGTVPLGPIELFAKAGYLFYDLNVKLGDEEIASASGSDEDFIYGAGIGLTLFGHLNARLEYEVIDVSENIKDADAVWLSGQWRF